MAVFLDQVSTLATAILRSRERSECYELRLSLNHLSALAKNKPREFQLRSSLFCLKHSLFNLHLLWKMVCLFDIMIHI